MYPPNREATLRARYLALVLAAVLLGGSAAPAGARQMANPAGAAVGDAGAAVAMMRLLAGSVPESSILPGLADLVSERTSFEAGFGLSNALANTSAALPYERSIARATPYGAALTDDVPSASSGLIQTAAPDNPKPATGPIDRATTPIYPLVQPGPLRGSAHARWSDTKGPCIGMIADASTETDRFSLGNAVATLPDIDLADLPLPGGAKLPKSFRPKEKLGSLGGLLAGTRPSGTGSLVRLPDGLSTRSTVEVVELGKDKDKAVRSISRVEAKRISLLAGSPIGMTATVRRAPTLTVTATGKSKTSTVRNVSPIITVRRGGEKLFTLDTKHPRKDIPIGVPKSGFTRHLKSTKVKSLPIVGGFAENTKGRAVRLSERARRQVVDLFVLRLSVGGLNTKSTALTTPFEGHQLGASARLLDVQLLPTEALVKALAAKDGPRELPYDVPSTLAQFAVGEQVARAAAPVGGAQCGTAAAAADQPPRAPDSLDTPSPAAVVRPLLWVGAVLLLGGAVLLALLRRPVSRRPTPTPSPRPRSGA